MGRLMHLENFTGRNNLRRVKCIFISISNKEVQGIHCSLCYCIIPKLLWRGTGWIKEHVKCGGLKYQVSSSKLNRIRS